MSSGMRHRGQDVRAARARLAIALALVVVLLASQASLTAAADAPSGGGALVIVLGRADDGGQAVATFEVTGVAIEPTVISADADDSVRLDDLPEGDYVIRAVDTTPGYAVEAVICREAPVDVYTRPTDERTQPVRINADRETYCVFHLLAPGSIGLMVLTRGTDAAVGTAVFSDPRGPASATIAVPVGRRIDIEGIPPGRRELVLLDAPPGVDIEAWHCDDWGPGHSERQSASTILLDIASSEEMLCLYDAFPPGSIVVVLESEPTGAEATFELRDPHLADAEPFRVGAADGMRPLVFDGILRGLYRLQMVDLDDVFGLTSAVCRDEDGQSADGWSDVPEEHIIVGVDAAVSLVCVFRVSSSGVTAGPGPTQGPGPDPDTGPTPGPSPDADASAPPEEPLPDSGQTPTPSATPSAPATPEAALLLPREGRWSARNAPGTMECAGIDFDLARETDQGTIRVRDGGRVIVARGLAGGLDLRLTLVDRENASYRDSVTGRIRAGNVRVRADIVVEIRVVTPTRIEGRFEATTIGRVGGRALPCRIDRDFTLRRIRG